METAVAMFPHLLVALLASILVTYLFVIPFLQGTNLNRPLYALTLALAQLASGFVILLCAEHLPKLPQPEANTTATTTSNAPPKKIANLPSKGRTAFITRRGRGYLLRAM